MFHKILKKCWLLFKFTGLSGYRYWACKKKVMILSEFDPKPESIKKKKFELLFC